MYLLLPSTDFTLRALSTWKLNKNPELRIFTGKKRTIMQSSSGKIKVKISIDLINTVVLLTYAYKDRRHSQ